MQPSYDMHLILNTHWDREWRWSFHETQMRLQEAMDALLDIMERDPRFACFLADSQMAMIDDYLEVRPENRERLARLVRAGRLQVGPWYTLPATFMVSGESLVRNLLLGHRLAAPLGGVTKCAYNVFSWGQISQMPQLYRQFGMDTIMFYRGIDTSQMARLEFWWEAPDGSRMLALTFGRQYRINFWIYVYLPYKFGRQGYQGFDRADGRRGFLVHFCDAVHPELNAVVVNQGSADDRQAALDGLRALRETLTPISSTPHLAFFQGFDLENPDPSIPDLVEWLDGQIGDDSLHISTLPEYMEAVKRSLQEQGLLEQLPVLRREMLDVERVSPEFGCLFPGVYSSRLPVKLANARAEVSLHGWAEPAAVWAAILGYEYPANFLDRAWKLLLQNQQHDGIGGTHSDRVMLATLERYRQVEDISDMIARKSLRQIVAGIDFTHLKADEVGLVVFNPLLCERTEVVEAFVDVPDGYGDPVYKGGYTLDSTLDILDGEGQRLPLQIIAQEDTTVKAYLSYGSSTGMPVRRFRVLFEARDVPQMGYACYTVRHRRETERPRERIAPCPNVLENEYLLVTIRPDGTLDVVDKERGYTYEGLHYFEDRGDQGGALYFLPPFYDMTYTTVGKAAHIVLTRNGPLMATYRLTWDWELPAELQAETRIHASQGGRWAEAGQLMRSARLVTVRIVTELSLRRGSRTLEFDTIIDNTAEDHRLRVLFPTHIAAMHSVADTPFDVVRRPVVPPDDTGWREPALTTFPSHSFVDVSDGTRGVALFHVGLPEYEVVADETRAIALTLLRCWGNPIGSETYHEQPLAQLPGEQRFRYGLYFHAGDWRAGAVAREAACFRTPLRIAQTTHHAGQLPPRQSFFTVDSPDLVFSGLKRAEYGEGFVLRLYNPTAEEIYTRLRTYAALQRASKTTLEELALCDLPVEDDHTVAFDIRAGEIVSLWLVPLCPWHRFYCCSV